MSISRSPSTWICRLELRALVPVLLTVLAVGCSDVSTTGMDTGGNTTVTRSVWQGTYTETTGPENGILTLDLSRSSETSTPSQGTLEGEIVFRSRVSEYPFTYAAVKGTQSGSDVTLELLADPQPWQFTFTASEDMGTLTGSFSASPWNLSADCELHELEIRDLVLESSTLQGGSPQGFTVHKDELWISQLSGSFERRTLKNVFIDNVMVYLYPDILWTSGPLTSDGTTLYGHYPVSVQTGNGSINESDIIRFNQDGTIVDRFTLAHRCSGLTWDGTDLWTVPITSEALYRFDQTGAILETVPIDIPDAQDVLFEGQEFWIPSWFLSLLYEVDRQGNIVAVYDLPQPATVSRSRSLTHDGERFWYLVSNLSGSTWIEQFHLALP